MRAEERVCDIRYEHFVGRLTTTATTTATFCLCAQTLCEYCRVCLCLCLKGLIAGSNKLLSPVFSQEAPAQRTGPCIERTRHRHERRGSEHPLPGSAAPTLLDSTVHARYPRCRLLSFLRPLRCHETSLRLRQDHVCAVAATAPRATE